MTSRENRLDRRCFLRQSLGGAALAGFVIVPRHVLGGPATPPPSEKLNVACIGAGGKGFDNVRNVSTENIAALCDVDTKRAADAFEMFYYDGQYHFFWQSNPAGRNWANMYWGHATSPDMIHWTERDHALRPFGGKVANRHPSMADNNCFSGSGNVELLNTAGWQKGDEKAIVLAFTDTGSLAIR